jgi:hypothetical protein
MSKIVEVTDADRRALGNIISKGDSANEKYWVQIQNLQTRILDALYPEEDE